MARESKAQTAVKEVALDVEDVKRRLNALDDRLDNIDSIVTAVAERVMSQPITLNINCPKCGKNIEITIIGREKPTK